MNTVYTSYLILNALIIIIAGWGYLEMIDFLKKHHRIDSPRSFSAFKKLARHNMYTAIIYLLLSIPTFLLGIYLIITGNWIQRTTVIIITAAFSALGAYMKKTEDNTRNLPCSNSRVQAAYQRIGECWKKKLLPDF